MLVIPRPSRPSKKRELHAPYSPRKHNSSRKLLIRRQFELPDIWQGNDENKQGPKQVDDATGKGNLVSIDTAALVLPIPSQPEVVDGRALKDVEKDEAHA